MIDAYFDERGMPGVSTIMFKCPCCGGYLEFDAQLQKFKCLYCGQILTEQELQEESARREEQADQAAPQAERPAGEENASHEGESVPMKGYHCQMCGAEIVTEATTAATRCYYCHSPIVLQDRLDDDFRPDGVIPFAMDKEAALREFMSYVSRKRFVDKSFFSEDQLEMFSGVYYPYWYFDVQGEAEFEGQGTRRSVNTTPSYIITTTRFFAVARRGRAAFRNIARKALGKLDGKLSDGIHPFTPDGIRPYASGYLSGFLAEKRDIEADALQQDVVQEAGNYADTFIRCNHSFHSLTGSSAFRSTNVERRYVLLPVWVLTFKGGKDGAPYYYLMNGQTGRVCGKLPVDRGKLLRWAIAAGAIVAGLLTLGGKLLW